MTAEVPLAIVWLHFAALTALLGYSAVTQLRRFRVLQQNRRQNRQLPHTRLRLLQVSLGLDKAYLGTRKRH